MPDAFAAVRRAVGCQSAVLESGLTVLVRPMPGYSSTYAIYGTRFGSIDLDFEVDGKIVHLPAGTAHFLEHKMFESEEGDAFARFARPEPPPTPSPASTRPATSFPPPTRWTKTWTSS